MTSPDANPWQVREADYPREGTRSERLSFLVKYAVLAPSSHNTQPWQFLVTDHTIELRADRSRRLAVIDPEDRELTISCGAALFHLLTAARHFRLGPYTELLPDTGDRDLLAVVHFDEHYTPSDQDDALFRSMPHRTTNRRPFEQRSIGEAVLDCLKAAADEEGALVEYVQGNDRELVAYLVAESDRHQHADPAVRSELARWVRPNTGDNKDGIPGHALGFGDLMAAGAPFMIRRFDLGRTIAMTDRRAMLEAPAVMILGTYDDTPGGWLEAGQALAKVLLIARQQDISASFMNQPIQVASHRERLARLLSQRMYPQVILRLGYAAPVRHSPRRSAGDVIISNGLFNSPGSE